MGIDGQDGRALLRAIKAAALPRGAGVLSIPVGQPVAALLRPVATRSDAIDTADVHVLSQWRNRFVQSFLTEFEANDERTKHWLTSMVGPDDSRILFMVDDAQSGETIGYMGLAYINWAERSGEADAIVRGAEAAPGLMKRALLTLLRWARQQLGLQRLGVRVRSDNAAIEFYRKLGFEETRRVPLRRTGGPDIVRLAGR